MDLTGRASIRGHVTRLTNSASEYLKLETSRVKEGNRDNLDCIEEELYAYIQRIKSAHDQLQKGNIEVRHLIKTEDISKDLESCAEYTDKAVGILARLEQRLARLRSFESQPFSSNGTFLDNNQSGQANRAFSFKLPKIQLRKFSGDFREWLPFWEQFRQTIHENASLSAVDKFNYLHAQLSGRAAEAIAGFTPSESCYDGAIALLLEEFGDSEKIIDRNMQQLMELQPVNSRTDTRGLRNLYNTITTSTRSLTALGIPSSHYAVMLKSVLLKCLPNELRVDYHRSFQRVDKAESEHTAVDVGESMGGDDSSVSFDGDTHVQSILKFLKKEVESLEKSRIIGKSTSSIKMNRTAAGLLTAATTTTLTAASTSKAEVDVCFFCNSTHHSTANCNERISLEKKKEMLKKDGRCFRCTLKGHTVKRCRVSGLNCNKCNRKHSSSLCNAEYFNRSVKSQLVVKKDSNEQKDDKSVVTVMCAMNIKRTKVYLQTACVFAFSPVKNKEVFVRLILDGGSQLSFIKQSLSHKLKLPVIGTQRLSVIPFGSRKQTPSNLFNRVRVSLKGQYGNDIFVLEALEVPEICLDVLTAPEVEHPKLDKFTLADSCNAPMQVENGISILIGADCYWHYVKPENEKITDQLMAINTVFGWTLQGPAPVLEKDFSLTTATTLQISILEEDNFQYINFWDLDILGIKEERIETEDFTSMFQANYIKKKGGRYEASLPWRPKFKHLDNNRAGALSRLRSLTQRLTKNSKLLEYDQAMRQFINEGFAERVYNEQNGDCTYFMPHRAVYRSDKETTKLRLVFDASAHAPDCASLNQCVLTGCNLLPDLLKILLDFRMGRIALTADIEKAFLQISLSEKDRNSHCFFWYASELKSATRLPQIQTYRMARVTFGVSCSPFILGATIQKHLDTMSREFPSTCKVLKSCFYVDDLILSTNSKEAAVSLHREAVLIMKNASMNLRKWNCNRPEVREKFCSQENCPDIQKILGVIWLVNSDDLSVNIESAETFARSIVAGTKRAVLQTLSRIFDPLGFLSPFVIRFKILFQSIWRLKADWDEILPNEFQVLWNSCCEDFRFLEDLAIPRCVFDAVNILITELHIFADASPQAYGAVAYVRSVDEYERTTVRFLYAKNRVAPLKEDGSKELTLPRLELTAALVAAKMYLYIKENINLNFSTANFWSDSQICIHWIKGTGSKLPPYVANRVRDIVRLTNPTEWRHCPGVDNPADLLTRGISGKELLASDLWTSGPKWLNAERCAWPQTAEVVKYPAMLLTFHETSSSSMDEREPIIPFEKFSSWTFLLRITAYVLRFVCLIIKSLKKSIKCSNTFNGKLLILHEYPNNIWLSADEIKRARDYWVQFVQHKEYGEEISALQMGREIPKSSRILSLDPILDSDGFLRVKGRLEYFKEYNTARPIIMPKSSQISILIVQHIHNITMDGGVNMVIAKLRETFWIPQARQLIRSVIRICVRCMKMKGKPATQVIAPLPLDRMSMTTPFSTTGIDFAGPLYVKEANESSSRKCYVMLLTCGTIRAVHLELVPDLSTGSCLLALRRFISRRGVPKVIYSDNAKTFKRAATELSALGDFVLNENLHGFLSQQGITWKFIVERAPWWGGFYERMVRTVKNCLKASIRKAVLNMDQLNTLITEVEYIINSRPLSYISDDPLDLTPLTPSHLLLGFHPHTHPANSDNIVSAEHIRQLWKSRFKEIRVFWKRWRQDYLQQLRSLHHANKQRRFASDVKGGDVVLVEDKSIPRIMWKLALVEEAYEGRDGKVRACLVRFANGSKIRRPVQLLYPLELKSNPIVPSPAGGCKK